MRVTSQRIDSDGKKRLLGLIEGDSENGELVKWLLGGLIIRGLGKRCRV